MRRQSNKKLTIAIIILALAIIFTGYQVYKYWYTPRIIEAQHFLYVEVVTDRNLTLEETLGYANDTTSRYVIIPTGGLYFYTLSLGQNLTRPLELENIWKVPVEIQTSTTGIGDWLIIEGQKVLEPKQTTTYNLTIVIPENITAGKHKGNLSIRFIPKE